MCPSYPQNKYKNRGSVKNELIQSDLAAPEISYSVKNRGPVKNKLIQSDLAAPEISYSVIKLQFLYLSITCICFKPLVSYFLVFFCKYLYNMSDQTNAVIVVIIVTNHHHTSIKINFLFSIIMANRYAYKISFPPIKPHPSINSVQLGHFLFSWSYD